MVARYVVTVLCLYHSEEAMREVYGEMAMRLKKIFENDGQGRGGHLWSRRG